MFLKSFCTVCCFITVYLLPYNSTFKEHNVYDPKLNRLHFPSAIGRDSCADNFVSAENTLDRNREHTERTRLVIRCYLLPTFLLHNININLSNINLNKQTKNDERELYVTRLCVSNAQD